MAAPWSAGAECRIVGELHGSQCINVFHLATNVVANDTGQLDTILQHLAEAMLECAIQALLPAVTSDYTLKHVDARRIAPTVSDPFIATAPANSVGERGPTSVSFAASLLNMRTGIGGRRGRGRKFLPPPGEADITASAMDNATLLLLTAFATCVATKFMGANASTEWLLGVYSKTDDNAVNGTFDNSFRLVTSLNPVADIALLSSRRKGRGA